MKTQVRVLEESRFHVPTVETMREEEGTASGRQGRDDVGSWGSGGGGYMVQSCVHLNLGQAADKSSRWREVGWMVAR